MAARLTEVEKRSNEAKSLLDTIQRQNPTHTLEYMKKQWKRQKEKQALIISETKADKLEQIGVLIELEENVLEAR